MVAGICASGLVKVGDCLGRGGGTGECNEAVWEGTETWNVYRKGGRRECMGMVME